MNRVQKEIKKGELQKEGDSSFPVMRRFPRNAVSCVSFEIKVLQFALSQGNIRRKTF